MGYGWNNGFYNPYSGGSNFYGYDPFWGGGYGNGWNSSYGWNNGWNSPTAGTTAGATTSHTAAGTTAGTITITGITGVGEITTMA